MNDKKFSRIFISHRDIYVPGLKIYTSRVSTSYWIYKVCRLINTIFYPFGLGCAINRYENSISFYSSAWDSKLYEDFPPKALYLNFGSGSFCHKKWKNYDFPGNTKFYRNIQGVKERDFQPINLCDTNLRLAEQNNTVNLIYCSHTLEHLEENASHRFLSECYRILQPGGIMRLALPNTSTDFRYADLLNREKRAPRPMQLQYSIDAASHMLSEIKLSFSNQKIESLMALTDFNPEKFYKIMHEEGLKNKFCVDKPESHITFWSPEKIAQVGSTIGFKFTTPFYQGSTFAAPFTNLLVFDVTEPHITFYVELIKGDDHHNYKI